MYRSGITYSEAVCEFKKKFILTVLQDSNGNQCKAARQLGMHRNTLSRTIAELKLDAKGLAQRNAPPAAQRAQRTDRTKSRSLGIGNFLFAYLSQRGTRLAACATTIRCPPE